VPCGLKSWMSAGHDCLHAAALKSRLVQIKDTDRARGQLVSCDSCEPACVRGQ
jgi:hypothetical protein